MVSGSKRQLSALVTQLNGFELLTSHCIESTEYRNLAIIYIKRSSHKTLDKVR